MPDVRLTSWASKQIVFDYADIARLTLDEDTVLVCLSPASRWFLLHLANFYFDWKSRFVNFPNEQARLDLLNETLWSLVMPVGCENDLLRIADAMEALVAKIADGATLLAKLDTMNGHLADLSASGATIANGQFPLSEFDDLEEILDGVGTILGAAAILP